MNEPRTRESRPARILRLKVIASFISAASPRPILLDLEQADQRLCREQRGSVLLAKLSSSVRSS